ncbi:hypothetical protein Tco_0612990 [Tanacetum coccineum]
MTTLKFVDTHNMVAFLSKPAESEGFEQIVDFLNAHTIKYALMVNPTIYSSCIEKFWATVKAKIVNGEVQLQALVNGKNIIITKSIVRRDLQLEDAEGVDCLPNDTIFEQLTLMSSKTTAWNEFSSTMAPTIIYLATNKKSNFSKYIFESMVKNLDNVGKFLMYLRVWKGFSGRVTPLFPTIVGHNQEEMGKCLAMPTDPHYTPTIIQPSTYRPQKTKKPKRPKRKDTELRCRAGHDNINKTQSKATLNEPSSIGTSSSSGPRHQETIGDKIAQTRSEIVSKLSNDPLLAREQTKTTQAEEIVSLKRRVKKLEQKKGQKLKGLKDYTRIHDIDDDEDITLVNDDNEMFDVDALAGEELKSSKPKADKVVIQEPEQGTTTTTPTTTIHVPKPPQDKGKGIMVEEPVLEQVKPLKRLELIRFDEELAFKLQAEKDEEERLAREKAQQQEELTDEEKARLFVQFLEKRRKYFTAKRAEEKRNRPPTRAQQRSIMCTYLKNMEAWKPKSLKNKSFTNIQEMFDKAMKKVNTFVDYRTELAEESSKKAETEIAQESSSKRAGTKLEQESIKKQKVDEDKETVELQILIVVIPYEEEIAIDVIPLATKPPTIVDWKIHKEGKNNYYQIIRADGSSKMYRVFSQMLKSFDKKDLEDLYKLVKAKYGSTRPVEDLDLILYGDLKTMFEPHVEDQLWKNQQDYRVLDWKIYDSCRVHSLRMQHVYIHMLVKKQYPLTPVTYTDMLNKKLQCDHFSEMVYQVLKLLTK